MPSIVVAALTVGLLIGPAVTAYGQTNQSLPADVPFDPASTRLFLTPTARMLPAGAVSLTLLGPLPLLQAGITDHLSFGAGVFPVSLGEGRPIVLLVPKWQPYHRGRTIAAVGALHFVGTGEATLGMAYGVVTRGDEDHAVTAGVGWLYARDQSSGGASPAVIVGAERRLGRHVKLLGDAYLAQGGGVASIATRLMGTRFGTRFSVDLGMMLVLADDDLVSLPAILAAWRF
jgi:hypothetical protein